MGGDPEDVNVARAGFDDERAVRARRVAAPEDASRVGSRLAAGRCIKRYLARHLHRILSHGTLSQALAGCQPFSAVAHRDMLRSSGIWRGSHN